MKSRFAGGRNIALKVPLHQYEATVQFYRDVLGLKVLENHLPAVASNSDRTNSGWIQGPASARRNFGWRSLPTMSRPPQRISRPRVSCDEIEPLPQGFDGFWIASRHPPIFIAVGRCRRRST